MIMNAHDQAMTETVAKLTAGWGKVLERTTEAFQKMCDAFAQAAESFRKVGRRMRRQAARNGTRGRRGSRSVGPWGMPWKVALCGDPRLHEAWIDGILDDSPRMPIEPWGRLAPGEGPQAVRR